MRIYGITFVEALEMPETTFESYFFDFGDSSLGEIIRVRSKRNEGKKLEKYEEDLYQKTKIPLTKEEAEELEEIQLMHIEEQNKAKEIVQKWIRKMEKERREQKNGN